MDKTKSELQTQLSELKTKNSKIIIDIEEDQKNLRILQVYINELEKALSVTETKIENMIKIKLDEIKSSISTRKTDMSYLLSSLNSLELDLADCRSSIDYCQDEILKKE